MVIGRQNQDIIKIIDAKNGNAGLTTNQQLLNDNGGTFYGSHRSSLLPKSSKGMSIPKNNIEIIKTNIG